MIRSTVPPGTGDAMQARLQDAGCRALVVNTPEFLAEGSAVHDFRQPARIVAGGPAAAVAKVLALFDGLPKEVPRIETDRTSAELAKYAANTFLAARVSLINEVANLADATGADVRHVARIVGLDPRIGERFLRPGIGYGGSCFPKDVAALAAIAKQFGLDAPVAVATMATNASQPLRVVEKLQRRLGELPGAKIAFWGIAFKPGTDDTREAPGLRIMKDLAARGATVTAHDPVALLPDGFGTQADDPLAAVDGAHALVHVTEWPQYQKIDAAAVKKRMAKAFLIDGRNALDLDAYRRAGFEVDAIGTRPSEAVGRSEHEEGGQTTRAHS